ncbi:MAG TPA: AAA family ATPase [Gemmatimonadaceae bacterium]|nr:AAA family ATPase [Gemmatimonadaceae bacterium]
MRLQRLHIREFKNLRSFTIEFADSLTTVLVGQNGTGKSNVLEALILIFRDLDLGDPPLFEYSIEYVCRGARIHVTADEKGRSPRIRVDGREISSRDFSRRGSERGQYLPKYLFGYYSGPSNRMEQHFAKHQEQFAADLLAGVDQPLRPLLYARLVHSQFVLLSFFSAAEDRDRAFLDEYLRIVDLDSVLFVLKKPSWASPQRAKLPGADDRFWGARGVVQKFLDHLHGKALAPIRLQHRRSKGTSADRLYLFLPDKLRLEELAKLYEGAGEYSQNFFKALESMYISDLIEDVRARVRLRSVDGALTFRELSEGEQQLLTVLGLLRFTREEEAVFFLDEPDTHLNPTWSLHYLELLRDIGGTHESSHIVMATHDPLVIAGLTKDEVQVMRRDRSGRVHAEHPEEDPKGMGISGLLTSDIYGLRSELDLETLRMLDRKRSLAIKTARTIAEEAELVRLNELVAHLDLTRSARDPYYKLFVDAMTRAEEAEGLRTPTLTPEQQERQRDLALEILRELQSAKDAKA